MIGAVAYGSYQIGKLSGKFSGYHGGYNWNQYNSWRSTDGFLCRNNNDCNWIDREFYCQDYELDFEPSVSSTLPQTAASKYYYSVGSKVDIVSFLQSQLPVPR